MCGGSLTCLRELRDPLEWKPRQQREEAQRDAGEVEPIGRLDGADSGFRRRTCASDTLHAARFKGWKRKEGLFDEQVVKSLRAGDGARPKPPEPKL